MSAINKTTRDILKAIIPARTTLQILSQAAVINDRIRATDLDLWLEVWINKVENGLYRGDILKKTGDFVLYDKEIQEWPDCPFSFTDVRAGKYEKSKPLPFLPLLKYNFGFFAATDTNRCSLKSVMYLADGSISSTDGHKLIHIAKEGEPNAWGTCLPRTALKALKVLSEYGNVEMHSYRRIHKPEKDGETDYRDEYASFIVATAGPATLVIKAIDSPLPGVAKIVSGHGEFKPLPGLKDVIDGLKSIEPYVSKRTGQVIFDGATLCATDRERSLEKKVPINTLLFPAYRIGFNIFFLLPVLEQLQKLSGYQYSPGATALGPCFFRTHKNETFVMMPLRIIDEADPEPEPETKPNDGETKAPEPETTSPEPETPAATPETTPEERKTEDAIKNVAETAVTEEFPNPPAPPRATDKPATYKQVRYLVHLTGKKFSEFKEIRKTEASALITELTKE